MKRTILLFIAISLTFASCNSKVDYTKVLQKTNLINYFSNDEIKELSNLLTEFENNLSIKNKSNEVIKNYSELSATLQKEQTYLAFLDKIESYFSTSKAVNQLVSNKLYSKIWKDDIGRINNSDVIDTLMNINPNGTYAKFLKDYAQEKPMLKEYINSLVVSGGMSPAMVAMMKEESQQLDFNDPVVRLIIAIHYFTLVNEEVITK